MSQHLYLISYDISEPKRLYQVHKVMKQYQGGGQKSCYECYMSATRLQQLKASIEALIDTTQDRIHIFQLDPRMHTALIGQARAANTDLFMLI